MGEHRIFLDTSGIFAWVNRQDPHHELMLGLPRKEEVSLIISDYVVDEACTLFMARKIGHRLAELGELLRHSRIVKLEWIGKDLFWEAWEWQKKFSDHPLSFTDCTSFALMKKMNLVDVATNDHHFETVGFRPLLTG